MKKVKNKLLLMFLVLFLSVSGLIGCKNDESKPTEKKTDISVTEGQEKESETGRLNDYPEGTFDGDEVCKYIEINGKVVEFPWTLNKLGDEYEFEDVKIKDNNVFLAKLTYNGEVMFDVAGRATAVNRDTPIIYVTFSKNDNVKICGIDGNSTSFDVEKKFGEPKKKGEDEICYIYIYETKEVQLIYWFFYDNSIHAFGISTTEDWNTEED